MCLEKSATNEPEPRRGRIPARVLSPLKSHFLPSTLSFVHLTCPRANNPKGGSQKSYRIRLCPYTFYRCVDPTRWITTELFYFQCMVYYMMSEDGVESKEVSLPERLRFIFFSKIFLMRMYFDKNEKFIDCLITIMAYEKVK